MTKRALLFILSLCLSACGFTPRAFHGGGLSRPTIRLINQSGDLELERYLYNQTDIAQHNDQAATVVIHHSSVSDRTFASGANNNTRLATLSYKVSYSLADKRGNYHVRMNTLSHKRSYTISSSLLLGSNTQHTSLLNELKRITAAQLLRRIQQLVHSSAYH